MFLRNSCSEPSPEGPLLFVQTQLIVRGQRASFAAVPMAELGIVVVTAGGKRTKAQEDADVDSRLRQSEDGMGA
jgi:hypothetical protein